MITVETLCVMVEGLRREDVERWIGEAWVRPEGEPHYVFGEIDVARVRLIVELRDQLRLDDEAMPVVLSLLDQLYDERRRLRRLRDLLVEVLPEEQRSALRRRVEVGPVVDDGAE
jgi:chaperone modulatory protein CbpM